MGFLEKVGRGLRDEVGKLIRQGQDDAKPARRAPRDDEVPEALRGPDPGTLLTAEEIERATSSPPVGEGDRRSGGMVTDVGFFRVCIWQLGDGGQLIVNSTRIRGAEGLALWRSRWDDPSWRNVDDEKELAGLGEAAKWYVTRSPKGGTELHVTAKQGDFNAALVHTSPSGARDIGPLTELMATLLGRLPG